jgi:ferredoxin-thioredoxin reductase catalytic subunit
VERKNKLSEQGEIKEITPEEVDAAYQNLNRDAEEGGYFLNPDAEFTKALISGLLMNEQRYGYRACPCRLASGVRQEDLDIICPCDYRDIDISQFNACFCGLYVSSDVIKGKKEISSIPERRPNLEERKKMEEIKENKKQTTLPNLPIWRCKVCGYLCAREEPPDICPICKVTKDGFERFM